MAGTKIYYVSGPSGNRRGANRNYINANRARIGWGSNGYGEYEPSPMTADLTPDIDNLVPFNAYWSPQAYIDWFNANVTAYGLATAQQKMNNAMGNWSSWGDEITYCEDPTWLAFFANNGVPITGVYCVAGQIVSTATGAVTNAENAVANAAKAASNATSSISNIATYVPYIVIGGVLIIGGLWAYNKYGKGSKMSGRRKRRRR